jgi:thiamine biosynthesis lipoprotein
MEISLPDFTSDIKWLHFDAMGSPCAIGYIPEDNNELQEFESDVIQWLRNFEARYSRYRPASLISRINANSGESWVDIDAETEAVFDMADRAFRISKGIFDPTALPLIKIWDYKKDHHYIPEKIEIDRARNLVGWDRFERSNGTVRLPEKGMGIDVGGICKEYAVDRVIEMAVQRGIINVIVDFGQDICVHGETPETGSWQIGLENPFQPGSSWTTLALKDCSVATSGSYYRNFTIGKNTFGHILDPRTGYPAESPCRAVTVVATSCCLAGILSTTAFIVGPEEGIRLIENNSPSEGCILTDSGCFTTKGFESYIID